MSGFFMFDVKIGREEQTLATLVTRLKMRLYF